ncbi:UNVERIFIED_CONTAM: Retrovirus-related Pol polyprotein from transposon RE1 [Sesamum indicum]
MSAMAAADESTSFGNDTTSLGVGDADVMQLQSSDHPGMVMVSALLTGANYFAWNRAVRRALTSKMKLEFVDGTTAPPPANTDAFKRWNRIDSMVTTWILNCMSKELAESFMYVASARELWLELEARYGESNSPMIYQLQREIGEVTQGNMSITEYYTKLKRLWDELVCLSPAPQCICAGCTCGINKAMADLTASNHLIQFLVGLNAVYDQARSQILLLEPLPSVTKAYSMLLRMEKQMQVSVGSVEMNSGAAFQMKSQPYKKKQVFDKRHIICEHCQKSGHTKDSCFKLHGVPDWYREMGEQRKKSGGRGRSFTALVSNDEGTRISEESYSNIGDIVRSELKKYMQNDVPTDPLKINFAQLDNFAGNCVNPPSVISSDWIIDSGATNHICADIQLFHSYTKLTTPLIIHLPNGHTQSVYHIGSVHLTTDIELTHVLHVPVFSVNLLSVRQLCASLPIRFKFLTATCTLQDQKTRKVLATAHLINHLYVLESTHVSVNASLANTDCTLSSHTTVINNMTLWHQRLGHLSKTSMKHIKGIGELQCVSNPCEICPLAKMQKLPFESSKIRSKSVFSLVHLDIWGPYKVPTTFGCHYFLTIVDDFSRSTWTFFMKYKSQTLETFQNFCKLISTQFNKQIQVIRTDNGAEFLSSTFQNFLLNSGILHQRSCAYTPQQNGVVERKHRTLLEIARSIMFQASFPRHFWGDAVLAATYLVNRFPSSVLAWKTPYEILHKRAPTYSHLRAIGCLCFAIKPEPHLSKFDKRSSKCVFVGYPPGQKAYKVYDLESKTFFTSRNVRFLEDHFPFASVKPTPSPIPLAVIPLTEDVSDAPSSPQSPSPSSDSLSPLNLHTSPAASPVLRRSQRTHHKPSWLSDFVCQFNASSSTPIFTNFSSAYLGFCASLSLVQEPRNYREAACIPHWTDAMKQELLALEKNRTWEVVPLPPGKSPIGCKWVYKTKLREDGSVERHKARLVAKGYTQVEGVDYTERFSPVAKTVTVRLFLALASAFQWPVHQIDINNAFLHGHLDEEIFMTAPEGYDISPGHACLLKRSLYGLKQASRQWNVEFTRSLEGLGFRQSGHDHCLFFKPLDAGFLGLLVYVDDVLIMAPSLASISQVKESLDALFTIKDLGCARYFLGLQIGRSNGGMSLTQSKYILDLVSECGLQDGKSAATPLPPGVKFSSGSEDLFEDPERYRRLVGRLLYLGFTRPDISHGVQQLSQFLQRPCRSHWQAALHLVRYLKGCSEVGLFFPSSNSLQLQAFCDADWGACTDTRRSLTGYAVFLGPALISWKTKKQCTVSRSSAEAEYRSMAATACELQWISYLLRDFGVDVSTPIPFHCDNQAALHIMANPVFHERTKHLDIDCHVVRDLYKSGFLLPVFVRSKEQVADLFTKPLSSPAFLPLLRKLGLFAFTPSPTCGGGVERKVGIG